MYFDIDTDRDYLKLENTTDRNISVVEYVKNNSELLETGNFTKDQLKQLKYILHDACDDYVNYLVSVIKRYYMLLLKYEYCSDRDEALYHEIYMFAHFEISMIFQYDFEKSLITDDIAQIAYKSAVQDFKTWYLIKYGKRIEINESIPDYLKFDCIVNEGYCDIFTTKYKN